MNKKIIPTKYYINVNINKYTIYKENRNKSGIYCWRNLITNKLYVGSAINLTKRLRDYFSVRNLNTQLLKSKSLIYSALLKYGYANFQLDILEYCDKNILIEREQYYIDIIKPEYNLLKLVTSRLGFNHTEETKKRISNTKKFCISPFLGKNHTTEAKLQISIQNSIEINVLDTFTNLSLIFKGNKEIYKFLNIGKTTLSNYKKSGKLIKGRYLVSNLNKKLK